MTRWAALLPGKWRSGSPASFAWVWWAAGEEATRAAVDSAAGLAQVAVDVLADDALAAAAHAEFEAAGGRFSVAEELG